jgi:hypothetical protein
MLFKGLKLDQSKIDDTIAKFENCTIKDKRDNGKNAVTYVLNVRDNEVLLNIYSNLDGTTSINPKTGKHHSISTEIAEHIKTHCELPRRENNSLSLNDVSREEFNTVIDFLLDSEATIIEEKNIDGGIQKKIKGKQGDMLVFKHFDKKSIQIQGKPILLFHEAIDILTQLFPFKEIINQQFKYYSIDLKPDEILKEMQVRIPDAYPNLQDRVKAVIATSIALNKIVDIQLSDFSAFAFPVLKGLEAILKKLFLPDHTIGKDGFKNYFDYNNHNGKYTLKVAIKADIGPKKNVCAEKLYNFYVSQRHTLMHGAGVDSEIRIIGREEAERIINSSLNIINEVYILLI